MKPYQPRPHQPKPRPHHNHTRPRGTVLYACSVLALTAAMWFCAGVYGYHAGLALRPATAEATLAAETAAKAGK